MTDCIDSQVIKGVEKEFPNLVGSILTQSRGAVAVGACMLSAAELDSSKDYVQRDSGEWAIAYHVSIKINILIILLYF